MSAGAGDDGLTRTTLRIDANGSAAAVADAVRALQRVPGVLLAEVNAASTGAIVAHDAAVPVASLLAAVAGAGGHAQFIADSRPRGEATPGRPAAAPLGAVRRVLWVVTWIIATVMVVDLLIPELAGKATWLLPFLIGMLWACFLGDAILRRRL